MADGATQSPATTQSRECPAREKRFSVAELDRMAASGLLNEPGRYELWDGRVMMAPPPGMPHMTAERKIVRAFLFALQAAGLLDAFEVQSGGGLELGAHNLRGPDIMILTAAGAGVASRPGPDAVALLIEIADSTLDDDLGDKRNTYADAGIAEYWVADVKTQVLHVFRAPQHGAYSSHVVLAAEEGVAVNFAPAIQFKVAEFF
jgi:Uma2 family endonuclease